MGVTGYKRYCGVYEGTVVELQQFWCTMPAARPIPPLVFLVLNKFLDLSHAMADAASAGRTQPRMGPSHLYLEFREAGTPTVDGIPGKLFKCVP